MTNDPVDSALLQRLLDAPVDFLIERVVVVMSVLDGGGHDIAVAEYIISIETPLANGSTRTEVELRASKLNDALAKVGPKLDMLGL